MFQEAPHDGNDRDIIRDAGSGPGRADSRCRE